MMFRQGSICDRWTGYVADGSIGKALWEMNWAGSMTVSSTSLDL